jgi:hypothetical protein
MPWYGASSVEVGIARLEMSDLDVQKTREGSAVLREIRGSRGAEEVGEIYLRLLKCAEWRETWHEEIEKEAEENRGSPANGEVLMGVIRNRWRMRIQEIREEVAFLRRRLAEERAVLCDLEAGGLSIDYRKELI